MDRPSWVPADVDINQPSIARVYDYFLGGSHNFVADREFADRMSAAGPGIAWVVQENRAFLGRAVRFLASQGIDQFLDIGSGIPTVGNVHEVAASIVTAPRVVYVDNDPVAVAHSRSILEHEPLCTIVAADMLEPESLLELDEVRRLIDRDRPVGILLAAVLHFVTDDDVAAGLIRQLAGSAAPGSYVAISHASPIPNSAEGARVESMYAKSVAALALRNQDRVTRLFDGLSLVEPGVVPVPRWRPDTSADKIPDDTPYPGYAGIGRVD